MRLLILLLLGAVLWATPTIEFVGEPQPSADHNESGKPEEPCVEFGMEKPIPSSADEPPFGELEPIEQAFLVDYPPGVRLDDFRAAANGGQRYALRVSSDLLPLMRFGDILIVVIGLHLLLLLTGFAVERTRMRLTRTANHTDLRLRGHRSRSGLRET